MPRLFIETVGCQMNMLDSEMVVAALRRQGYELTRTPQDADTILFNTCSVRQHAEDKIYSALGRIKQIKARRPQTVLGVMGCMAQKDQQLIFERAAYVDFIVGPGQLAQVPELIARAQQGEKEQVALSLGRKAGAADEIRRSHESFDPLRDVAMRPTPFQAYLRIQYGCDKFCTYCIVPMVRGPEQGRSPRELIEEAKTLADQGCKEITLVGQTVNSYRYQEGERTWRLSGLLAALAEVPGIERLKFVTNYPKDVSDDLLSAMRDVPQVMPYLHVPVQSGSNAQLLRMKRGYTVEEYLEMFERVQAAVPGVAMASDFIVGFCGETEADFQASVELVRRCRFKNSFIFKYSPRPLTKAHELFPDDVPEEEKDRRNNDLLAVQNEICEQHHLNFLGRTVEVLVEGPSKWAEKEEQTGPTLQLTGRTPCDRIVVFDGKREQIGQLLRLGIFDCTPHTLFGAPLDQAAEARPLVALS